MFIFSADWHLSKLTWTDRPEIADDSYRSVSQIVDLAVNTRSPLLAAGDLFDKRSPDTESVVFMCRQMDRLQAAGVPLYYIQGQHELRDPPWFSAHLWPKHMHGQSFVVDGLRFYGLDWTPRGELQRQLDLVPPDTDVLMCHQVWTELMGGVGQQDGAISDVSFVRYVMTGDYHKTLTAGFQGKTGQVRLCSPGSVSVRKIDEPADKYVFVCNVDKNREISVASSRLDTRSFQQWSAGNADEFDQLCASLREHTHEQLSDTRQVIRLTYSDAIPDVVSRFSAAADGKAHVFYNPVSREVETTTIDMTQATDEHASSLVEAVALLSPGTDIGADAQLLLNAPDQRSCWERLYNTFMADKPQVLHDTDAVAG